jgi:hypothetical protein
MPGLPLGKKFALLLAALGMISVAVLATPVQADPKPGRNAGSQWPGEKKHDDKDKHGPNGGFVVNNGDWNGPARSGAAHWCALYWFSPDAESEVGRKFGNHGDCVNWFAWRRSLERQIDLAESIVDNGNGNGNGNDNGSGGNGDLQILSVRLDLNGHFRLLGAGAESEVNISELRGNGVSIDVFAKFQNNDGIWIVDGRWDCSDHDGTRDGRFEAKDNNESDRLSVSFPCGALSYSPPTEEVS